MTSSRLIEELEELGKTLRIADPFFLHAVKEAAYDLISHSLQPAPMGELIWKDQRKNKFPSRDPNKWLTNFGKSSEDRYNEALRGCDKILKALQSLEEIILYIDACHRSGLEEANHRWKAVIHERDMTEKRADVETPGNASDNRIKAKSSGATLIKVVYGEDLPVAEEVPIEKAHKGERESGVEFLGVYRSPLKKLDKKERTREII